MEISLTAGELAKAIGLIKGAVPTRTTLPILNNIRIQADEQGYISLTGSCIDMQATARERCEVFVPGDITINGQALSGLAKGFGKSKSVTIKAADGWADITCGSSHYRVQTLPVDTFPMMDPEADAPPAVSVASAELKAAIMGALPTVAPNDYRPQLKGMNIRPSGDGLAFASSDGLRFACCTAAAEDAERLPHAIVPPEAMRAIATLCEASESVMLAISPRRITAVTDAATVTARLIEAKFSDYHSMIPEREPNFVCDFDEISGALDRLLISYAGIENKMPLCVIDARRGEIEFRSSRRSPNKGREIVSGEIARRSAFCVSIKFLTDAVNAFSGAKTICVQFDGGNKPIVITSDDVPRSLFLIQPMNSIGEIEYDQLAIEAA